MLKKCKSIIAAVALSSLSTVAFAGIACPSAAQVHNQTFTAAFQDETGKNEYIVTSFNFMSANSHKWMFMMGPISAPNKTQALNSGNALIKHISAPILPEARHVKDSSFEGDFCIYNIQGKPSMHMLLITNKDIDKGRTPTSAAHQVQAIR